MWRESDGKECLGFERDLESDFSRPRPRQFVWREGVGDVVSNKCIKGHQGNMFF